MLGELRPVFAALPASALRMELMRLVSGTLALPESLVETVLSADPRGAGASGRAQGGGSGRREEREAASGRETVDRAKAGGRPGGALSRGEDTERAFLALCIASPDEGEAALADVDVASYFTSDLLRRAAQRLRADLRDPLRDGSGEAGLDGDPELRRCWQSSSCRRDAKRPIRRCCRCSGCSWSSRGWSARYRRRGCRARRRAAGAVGSGSRPGREPVASAGLRHAGRRSSIEFDRAQAQVLEETGDRGG